jgi:hypothetical protein
MTYVQKGIVRGKGDPRLLDVLGRVPAVNTSRCCVLPCEQGSKETADGGPYALCLGMLDPTRPDHRENAVIVSVCDEHAEPVRRLLSVLKKQARVRRHAFIGVPPTEAQL